MDLEIIIVSEVNQTKKDKYDIAYMQNPPPKKRNTNELIYKTKIEKELMINKGRG